MAHPIFSDPTYRWISAECETLKKFEPRVRGDKLAVENDHFVISEGGLTQSLRRTVLNCSRGGYNRDAVLSHFEKIALKVHDFVQNLRREPNYLTFPETRELADKLTLLRHFASQVEFSYRSLFGSNPICAKFLSVYEGLHQEYNSLTQSLGMIDRLYHQIPQTLPSDQTIAETVQLAKNCPIPFVKKIVAFAIRIFLLFASTLLVPFKWLIWNPIEFVIRGKVTTQNPLDWAIKQFDFCLAKQRHSDWLINRYAQQLLHTPFVTNEHIEGFEELAPLLKIDEICLSHFIRNERERLYADLSVISLPILLRLIYAIGKIPSCKKVLIPSGLRLARSFPNNPYYEELYQDFVAADRVLRRAGFHFSSPYYIR